MFDDGAVLRVVLILPALWTDLREDYFIPDWNSSLQLEFQNKFGQALQPWNLIHTAYLVWYLNDTFIYETTTIQWELYF